MSIRFSNGNGLHWDILNGEECSEYSDGTPLVKTEKFEEIAYFATAVTIRPTSMSEFMAGLFLADAVRYKGGNSLKLVLPYVPGARQDRSNFGGDILFTAASVARVINSFCFDNVIILDPHSNVTPYHITRSIEYPLKDVVLSLMENSYKQPGLEIAYDGIIAPDKGAIARANIFSTLSTSNTLIQATKKRDQKTGALSEFKVEVPPGRHYLVVDDICDGGGTFIGLCNMINEQGSTADLWVTHGIFSKGVDRLKSLFGRIYTTDSIDGNDHNTDLTVVPVVNAMEMYKS